MTEVDGKATGWKAFYQKGKWQQEQSGSGGASGGASALERTPRQS